MVCICTPLGLHPPFFFPEKAGKDYELSPYLEVFKDFRDDFTVISGLSHPDVGPSHDSNLQLPDRGPASGAAGRLPQQHLARPVRGRSHRRPDALPQPGAVVRGLRPVLDPQRRARADGRLAVERVRQAVPRRPPRRSPGPGPPAGRRPEHPRRGPRPGQEDEARPRRRRPREARRVLHQRPRAGAAAGAGRGMVEEAQAQGRRQAAPEHPEQRRPRRQDPALVRPDPPGLADRLDPADHAATAGHQQRAADPGRDARAITTCRTTARTRPRSRSSRRSSWKR